MTAFLAQLRAQRGSRQAFTLLVVGMCLVLLALLAVAQVTHLHPNQSDADHCQLCIVMHTLVPGAVLTAAIVLVQLGASASQSEPTLAACRFLSYYFIRPPPASC